jgi:hypothetical protein
MSFNKVGFAVASKMDEILTSKAFKKIASKDEDAKKCCEDGCEKDCKCKKKVATKNDIIVSLISTSERLDRLGFNKIAQDLLDPADDLLEESEEDEIAGLSKEKSLDLDIEDEEFDDIINDLKNGDSWSEKSFDDIDEDGGSLFDSMDEEEDEDDFMAWDANDGDLVDNLKLDLGAESEEEMSGEDIGEKSIHERLYEAIESNDEDKINYFLDFDNKFINMAIAHRATLSDIQLDMLLGKQDSKINELLLENSSLTDEQKDKVLDLELQDSAMDWDDEDDYDDYDEDWDDWDYDDDEDDYDDDDDDDDDWDDWGDEDDD